MPNRSALTKALLAYVYNPMEADTVKAVREAAQATPPNPLHCEQLRTALMSG